MFKCKLATRTGSGQNRPFEANQPLISYVLLKKKTLKQRDNDMMVHFKYLVNVT